MSWSIKEQLKKVVAAEEGTAVFAPGSRRAFALAYPNTYRVGMSNLGFQIIYQQINGRGDTACERVFLPDAKTGQEHVRTATPLLTLETQRPLYEYPLLGFAVSFEMDYFNLLKILELGRVPLLAAERDESHPLVIVGGPCATFNPEPIADFIDIGIVGEGEEVIHELLDACYAGLDAGLSRRELLRRLAAIEGIYVPSLYRPEYGAAGALTDLARQEGAPAKVSRRWIRDLDRYGGQTVIVTDDTEFKDMFLIEISRGCGRHCRFCMAGYCFRRPRSRSPEALERAVDLAKTYRHKVGLVGAAVSDYPDIDRLVGYIVRQGMKFSVASLRADSLSDTLVGGLKASGHRTITLAPEAASPRLRSIINKGITDAHLEEAVAKAVGQGIPNVRLYIMVGLPFEEDGDIAAIAAMARSLKRHMESLGSGGKLSLSINPFVPKPFTPFQWLPMTPQPVVEKRLEVIRKSLSGEKGIEVLVESTREAYIQGVLARGDRRLGALLLAAHKRGGVKGWKAALRETGVDEAFYLYRRREKDELFPWDCLDIGVNRGYLAAELARAERGDFTPPCADGCRRCGVC